MKPCVNNRGEWKHLRVGNDATDNPAYEETQHIHWRDEWFLPGLSADRAELR